MKPWLAAIVFLASFTAFADGPVRQPEIFKDPITGVEYATGYIGDESVKIGATYYKPSPHRLRALPAAFDSREKGWVPGVRNQGNCGSCWDFAMLGSFEIALAKAGHKTPIDLSEQDILANDSEAYGCGGGFMNAHYIQDYGVTLETTCPYRANDRVRCDGEPYAKSTRWALLSDTGLESVKAAIVDYGSVFMTVAAGAGFSPNSAGEIRSCNSRSINHMVGGVGYQEDNDVILRNSWGISWGNGGYAYTKLGCNKYGDDVGFIYVEGTPGPKPLNLQLPIEVVAAKDADIAIEVPAAEGVKYKWSAGITGPVLWLKAKQSAVYQLTATDASGAETSSSVQLTVAN